MSRRDDRAKRRAAKAVERTAARVDALARVVAGHGGEKALPGGVLVEAAGRIVVPGEHHLHLGEGDFTGGASDARAYADGERGAERWDARTPADARDVARRAPGSYGAGKP